MPPRNKPERRRVFIIVDSSAIPLPNPAWVDEHDQPVIFDSEHDAQIEIAEWMIEKLTEFIAGERDFYDATACTDFVVAIDLAAKN